ncbi:hypothetical protein [Trichodesmium erythraeum]|uniref:hypothetical protein n=1 Tax=Trichodesmium erythraeum TaxID=1206 RepID=UPI00003C9B9F
MKCQVPHTAYSTIILGALRFPAKCCANTFNVAQRNPLYWTLIPLPMAISFKATARGVRFHP